ncbi:MurR/RpiR family transcriptional regulator [Microlunatus sp. Gsoil 973]|uniref:MurR/RpiR family transcriptional regulator n=1 Tax=Microlunatus sp. Gsoil 973 TaxID=2672569 RepID=UPI0012B4A74E|nr:MurR/RpiR family transcriptional regulator [Microlunatus sp. Gsoil 973]QGN32174.1 SIS domain-containing protein [Microlunatus sp. Gsoil 973]
MDAEPSPAATGVRGRITSASLRPSERRVALCLLADYPAAALSTAGELARTARVSTQTVIRFVRALGFASFADLQDALREELRAGLGPLSKLRSRSIGETADLAGFARVIGDRAIHGFERIPATGIEAAVDLLTDQRGQLLTVGGRFSTVLARHLATNLQALRAGVRLLDDPPGASLPDVVDLGARDVVVVFDVQRYQPAMSRLAATAAGKQASVLVITDEPGSPAADHAAVRLAVDVAAPSALDTLAGGLLLVEYLVARVLDRLGESAQQRLQVWESARSADFS